MHKLLLILVLPSLLCAGMNITPPMTETRLDYTPWFTGTLLAPTAINMKKGHPGIELFVTAFNFYAKYDSNWKLDDVADVWSISPGGDFQMAFTENTGIEVLASTITNFQQGRSSTHFEDTSVLLGYQISNDQPKSWIPDCRLTFNTIFPTGNHDDLDPTLNGIDSSGQGAYFFGPALACQKLFHLKHNYFVLHWSLGYLIPLRANIKGLSVYGGAPDTKGSLIPGQTLIAFLSGEYTFTQNWVFQFDTQYLFQFASHDFEGRRGTTSDGNLAQVGLPNSFQLGVTLGLEYNFSNLSGILFGTWFTLAGFNSQAFAAGFLGYVYIF